MTLPSISNQGLLVLWVELAALVVTARLLGALARRLGQPAVVGELAAGVVLGPSLFGHLWRPGFEWFLPRGAASVPLLAVSALSLVFLLTVIGAETDLRLIRQHGRAAASVSLSSLLVPLAAGAALAVALPPVLVGHGGRPVFVVLVAAAVAVSSLPVVAKIVAEMGLVRRDVGQIAIAAATANDATGFVLLALASGLAAGSAGQVAVALVGLLAVGGLLLTVGQRLIDHLLREARRRELDLDATLAIWVVGTLGAAAAVEAIGVEGALGAFVAGMVLGRSRFQQARAGEILATATTSFFSPLYFSTAGLRVDVSALGRPGVGVSFVLVTVVAMVSKFLGARVGGWAAGLHRREATALGVGLNGRGALQVVIGTGGLAIGALDTASYTVVILMSLVTSLAVPPLLRSVVRGWEGTPEEQERLEREEEMDRNVVVRGQRLLVASRGSPNSQAAAMVVAAAWPVESEVTVLSVTTDGGQPPELGPVLELLGPRSVEHRDVGSEEVLEEILTEARLGYGVIALGAAEEPGPQHLLSAVVDDLLVDSPVPLLVVRRGRESGAGRLSLRKVLVPVSGTPSSRAGQEVACSLGRALGIRVVLAHVVTRSDGAHSRHTPRALGSARAARSLDGAARRGLDGAAGAAQVVMRGAWAMANDMGVEPEVVVRHGSSPGEEIVAAVRQSGADAVALGTTVRRVEGHPFLGHTVEHVLSETEATVIAVVLPELSSHLGALVAEAGGNA